MSIKKYEMIKMETPKPYEKITLFKGKNYFIRRQPKTLCFRYAINIIPSKFIFGKKSKNLPFGFHKNMYFDALGFTIFILMFLLIFTSWINAQLIIIFTGLWAFIIFPIKIIIDKKVEISTNSAYDSYIELKWAQKRKKRLDNIRKNKYKLKEEKYKKIRKRYKDFSILGMFQKTLFYSILTIYLLHFLLNTVFKLGYPFLKELSKAI